MAALEASGRGLGVVVVEKAAWIGGATAYSGGTLWLLDNPFLKERGIAESREQARRHMDAVVGHAGPASSPARRDAYVDGGRALVELMARHEVPLVHSGWADYYAERDGGVPQGRTVHTLPFDARRLGADRELLRPAAIVVPANSVEVAVLALGPRTPKAAMTWLRVGLRTILAKLRGAVLLTRGQALVARLFEALTRAKVPIWRSPRWSNWSARRGGSQARASVATASWCRSAPAGASCSPPAASPATPGCGRSTRLPWASTGRWRRWTTRETRSGWARTSAPPPT